MTAESLARLEEIVKRTPSERDDPAAHWKGRWEFVMEMMDAHGLENWSLMKERDAARARIAAALACHTLHTGDYSGVFYCHECGWDWDTEADRCTSPTVTALLA